MGCVSEVAAARLHYTPAGASNPTPRGRPRTGLVRVHARGWSRDGAEAPEQFRRGDTPAPHSRSLRPMPSSPTPYEVRRLNMGSIWEDAPAIPTGGAYALQGRCRATPAGAIPSSPARWGVSGGQDRPGRPNPRGLRRDRCRRLWDQGGGPGGAERGLGSGLLCREML
jgi:hypothetical protein